MTHGVTPTPCAGRSLTLLWIKPTQAFGFCQASDSDSERRLAIILEDDTTVIKWIKPATGKVRIDYASAEIYNPDFIVETHDHKYMCEPKRANQVDDAVVRSKALAAATWCQHATAHAQTHGGKPWSYLLIPHDQITSEKTMQGLAAAFTIDAAA